MKLIAKIDVARLATCSPATVSRAVKTVLSAALIGDRVDVHHPSVVAFIDRHRRRKAQ
jgi:hypothetical protein